MPRCRIGPAHRHPRTCRHLTPTGRTPHRGAEPSSLCLATRSRGTLRRNDGSQRTSHAAIVESVSINPSPSQSAACLQTVAVFAILIAPLYLLLRLFVKAVRQTYGFDTEAPDEEPPLRICARCHNTVMEREFAHCPYCGALMPDAEALPE